MMKIDALDTVYILFTYGSLTVDLWSYRETALETQAIHEGSTFTPREPHSNL